MFMLLNLDHLRGRVQNVHDPTGGPVDAGVIPLGLVFHWGNGVDSV